MDENAHKSPEPEKQKARVKQVKASGAVLTLSDGGRTWLPGHEMYPDYRPYEDFRESGKDL